MGYKKKISILIVTFAISLFAIIGITYAFFVTTITPNSNLSTVKTTTKDITVEYQDGTANLSFMGDYFLPGNFVEKSFTVENKGAHEAIYSIVVDNVVNTFVRTQDLHYDIYIDSTLVGSGTINNNSEQTLLSNITIAGNKTDNVKFVLTYLTTTESQNVDVNKNLSLRFDIVGAI